MRRTIAALLIFAAALGFSACCEAYSLRVTQTLCSSAQAIKQQAQAGDFAAAEAALSQTEEYFSAHQAGLEVFSQRTGVYSLLCFERLASSSESSFINVSMSLNWRYTEAKRT